MSILQRPGWVNRAPYHPADQQRLIAEARVLNIVKQAEQKFLKALQASGHSMKFLGSPQAELYKFVGQIILNTPELSKYFPDVTKARHLKSSHIARLATIEGGDQSIGQLQKAIDDTFDNIEKFKAISGELHVSRRAKSAEEIEELGDVDTREKVGKWHKKLNAKQKAEPVVASAEDIEGAERTGAKVSNIYKMMHALGKLKLKTGETLDDVLREDDSIVQALKSASTTEDFMENLLDLGTPVALDIYAAVKSKVQGESVKLTARQTDQLLQEQRVKARQHRFMVDERYGR